MRALLLCLPSWLSSAGRVPHAKCVHTLVLQAHVWGCAQARFPTCPHCPASLAPQAAQGGAAAAAGGRHPAERAAGAGAAEGGSLLLIGARPVPGPQGHLAGLFSCPAVPGGHPAAACLHSGTHSALKPQHRSALYHFCNAAPYSPRCRMLVCKVANPPPPALHPSATITNVAPALACKHGRPAAARRSAAGVGDDAGVAFGAARFAGSSSITRQLRAISSATKGRPGVDLVGCRVRSRGTARKARAASRSPHTRGGARSAPRQNSPAAPAAAPPPPGQQRLGLAVRGLALL